MTQRLSIYFTALQKNSISFKFNLFAMLDLIKFMHDVIMMWNNILTGNKYFNIINEENHGR